MDIYISINAHRCQTVHLFMYLESSLSDIVQVTIITDTFSSVYLSTSISYLHTAFDFAV
jgi:hypothetical protein